MDIQVNKEHIMTTHQTQTLVYFGGFHSSDGKERGSDGKEQSSDGGKPCPKLLLDDGMPFGDGYITE